MGEPSEENNIKETPKTDESNFSSGNDEQKANKFKDFFKSKKFIYLLIFVSVVFLVVSVAYFFVSSRNGNESSVSIKEPLVENVDSNSKLPSGKNSRDGVGSSSYINPTNGVYLTKDEYEVVTSRKPVAIMMNNHVDSRPQSGISQADVVYEMVAESGISRLMAVFHSFLPERVGSIRSARIYYMQVAAEYWPIFSHWGIAHRPAYELSLSPEEFENLLSLGEAETDPQADARSYIDEISLPVANTDTTPNMFYRETGINAAVEHTGYAKLSTVYDEFSKFYQEPSWLEYQPFDVWEFKDDGDNQNTNSVASISYNFWDFTGFYTIWSYNSEKNCYERNQGGIDTTDRNTEEKVCVKNLVIQRAKETKLNDKKAHLLYDVIGENTFVLYRDGKKVEGIWEKSSARERTVFKDLNGQPVSFNRGQIWITVLPEYSLVEEE